MSVSNASITYPSRNALGSRRGRNAASGGSVDEDYFSKLTTATAPRVERTAAQAGQLRAATQTSANSRSASSGQGATFTANSTGRGAAEPNPNGELRSGGVYWDKSGFHDTGPAGRDTDYFTSFAFSVEGGAADNGGQERDPRLNGDQFTFTYTPSDEDAGADGDYNTRMAEIQRAAQEQAEAYAAAQEEMERQMRAAEEETARLAEELAAMQAEREAAATRLLQRRSRAAAGRRRTIFTGSHGDQDEPAVLKRKLGA